MVRLFIALDVEEGVPVPHLGLAWAAEGDAGRLGVPHQQVAVHELDVGVAVLAVEASEAGHAGVALDDREKKFCTYCMDSAILGVLCDA